MWRYLVLGVTLAFAAVVQPGPLQGYLANQALSRGWRRAAPAALAPLVSDGPIIALVLLVLTQLPAWLERTLQGAGGLFLLYLAFGALREWRRARAGSPTVSISGVRTLFQAATVNILNPNPYLGWSLVMGPIFLRGWRERPAHGLALLLGFYATMVIGLLGTIVAFSAAGRLGPRLNRVLLGLSAIALAGIGIYQLLLASGVVSW